MAEITANHLHSPLSLSFQEPNFSEQYAIYTTERDILLALELTEHNSADQRNKVVESKEVLAGAATHIHTKHQDITAFKQYIAHEIRLACSEYTANHCTDTVLFSEYIAPLSHRETIPSPIESIMVTAENHAIAAKFAMAGESTLTGLVMSGANAWGAYFAPRGKHPALGESEPGGRSDIDLLAVAPDIDAIGSTIENYITAGLVDETERIRFEKFKELHRQGEVDIYSIRANYKGVEESIHFLTHDIMDAVTSVQSIRTRKEDGYKTNYLRDFRPNLPNNPNKNGGGYTIDDLKGLRVAIFRPRPTAVENGQGCISESPLGTIYTIQGEQTYSLGLMDYFLAVLPKILVDTPDQRVASWIKELQTTIAHIQGEKEVVNVPRQLRMPKGALRDIQSTLSLR